ncbi:hypothetical protein ACFQ36_14405 [Arthrobacter sp. GCM10027362]|uniref:hypothetical protein n=1 Tax=Arthrobacter sp. GCM10027362 TaxID=3273379 RepID=UPI003635F1A2
MNGMEPAQAIRTIYTGSAESNSKDPHDWGRAMAAAMSDLLTRSSIKGSCRKELFGEDLRLTVAETTEGVQITLTWNSVENSPE